MHRDDLIYLSHMLETARKAVAKAAGKTRGDFDADEDLRIVLAHLVQIIGEAARRVSAESQARHPEIPWNKVVGMRHRIVHDYLNINEGILWDVVTVDLHELIGMLTPVVPPEDPSKP